MAESGSPGKGHLNALIKKLKKSKAMIRLDVLGQKDIKRQCYKGQAYLSFENVIRQKHAPKDAQAK